MRRFVALCLITALLSVSSLPALPMAMAGDMQEACPVCHMDPASMDHARHTMKSARGHCQITCSGHHGLKVLPHLLAPHTVSQGSFEVAPRLAKRVIKKVPVVEPELFPFPTPPPRSS